MGFRIRAVTMQICRLTVVFFEFLGVLAAFKVCVAA